MAVQLQRNTVKGAGSDGDDIAERAGHLCRARIASPPKHEPVGAQGQALVCAGRDSNNIVKIGRNDRLTVSVNAWGRGGGIGSRAPRHDPAHILESQAMVTSSSKV